MPQSNNRHSKAAQRRRKKTRQKEAQGARLAAFHKNCPTPRKTRFDNRESADAALQETWNRVRPGAWLPVRSYLCDCGAWHHTSKEKASYDTETSQ